MRGDSMKGKIFTAQEVQAIIAGNKTQFREVIKVQPSNAQQQFSTIECSTNRSKIGKHIFIEIENQNYITNRTKPFKCPYQVGQKIFCKESFSTDWVNYDDTFGESCVGDISYEATWEKDNAKGFFDEPKWKPAQHMKQEQSRLTLQIKEIRVERLSEISEEDALKEGVEYNGGCEVPSITFKMDWNATHKKPEEKFEANPFVWSIQFEVVNE